jgi:hypothetical protein
MSLTTNPDPAMNLTPFVARLKADATFLTDFKETLASANANDANSLAACKIVDSWLKPTDQELLAVPVPPNKVGPLHVCTDSGNLALILAKL